MQTKIFLMLLRQLNLQYHHSLLSICLPISITAAAVTVASMYVVTGEDDPSEP